MLRLDTVLNRQHRKTGPYPRSTEQWNYTHTQLNYMPSRKRCQEQIRNFHFFTAFFLVPSKILFLGPAESIRKKLCPTARQAKKCLLVQLKSFENKYLRQAPAAGLPISRLDSHTKPTHHKNAKNPLRPYKTTRIYFGYRRAFPNPADVKPQK